MRVIVHGHESLEDSHRGEGSYADWRERYDFSIDVKLDREDEYLPHSADRYLIRDSDHCYVIYIRYGTGDSFGRADGRGMVVHAFGNKDIAEKVMEDLAGQLESYHFVFSDDFGREIRLSNPGAGYFESVDELVIQIVPLN